MKLCRNHTQTVHASLRAWLCHVLPSSPCTAGSNTEPSNLGPSSARPIGVSTGTYIGGPALWSLDKGSDSFGSTVGAPDFFETPLSAAPNTDVSFLFAPSLPHPLPAASAMTAHTWLALQDPNPKIRENKKARLRSFKKINSIENETCFSF